MKENVEEGYCHSREEHKQCEFSTEQFASEMNMSRSNLHLKLKAILNKSAIDFIHKIRFNRACQLLK